jgi:hypothetical protein
MTTNIRIASQALARLGEPSISAFDEDSDTAEKVSLLYESTILSLFSSYDWRFAMTKVELEIDATAAPVNRWTRGFLLPTLNTDRVGPPHKVYNTAEIGSRVTWDYEIQERWIMTNETQIVIEYIKRQPESVWPGYFVKLAIEAVAAALALPVTENQSKDEYHNAIAFGSPAFKGRGGLMAVAMEADANGNPTRSLLDDDDPIGAARFGGRW